MRLRTVTDVIDGFLLQVLVEPHRPHYLRPCETAMHHVFGFAAQRLSSYGEVHDRTDYTIAPACDFRVHGDSPTVWVWLSAVLPYTTVVVAGEEGRSARFLSDITDEVWSSSLRHLLQSWGFLVLDGEVWRAMSPIHDYADEHQRFSVFEALFEDDVDPPWEWMGPGPGA